MIAVVAVVVVSVGVSGGVLAGVGVADRGPRWCAQASHRLQSLEENAREGHAASADDVDGLIALLPPLVGLRARGDIGREGRLSAAVDAAALAVRVGCAPVVVVDTTAEVAGILKDDRFGGLRTEDDFSEKLKDRLWRFVQELVASEGMQVFADNTRVIYLTFLAVVCGVVAVRLLRRAQKPHVAPATSAARIARERQKACAAWRAEAVVLLDGLDPQDPEAVVVVRRIVLLLRAALLARVGEGPRHEAAGTAAGGSASVVDAVRPSRTSSETLTRLPPAWRALVAPALQAFDDVIYGPLLDGAGLDGAGLDRAGIDRAGLDGAGDREPVDAVACARRLLRLVDDVAASLGRLP